jgi:type VI secretion system secreted protein VgrG
MRFDIAAAVKYLDDNKASGPTSHCARYVRLALQAGGINTAGAPVPAKDYGPFLLSQGFQAVVFKEDDDPTVGDVVVIQPYKGGSVYGHVAMYNGDSWVSDFEQTDIWSGPGYRKAKPSFQVYRFKSAP